VRSVRQFPYLLQLAALVALGALADVLLARELRSGQPERIRGALARVGDVDPALAHLLVGLLERDEVLPQVVAALRRGALRITGQLVDALVDPQRPARVRRRVPRVLEACPGPRAVEGLVLGLADADFSVRRACGVVLALLREKHAELAMPAPALYEAVLVELAHVGMVDAGRGARLAPEAPARRLVPGQRHRLERDYASEPLVARRVHDAHAPLAQLARDRVVPDAGACRPRRRRAGVRRAGRRVPPPPPRERAQPAARPEDRLLGHAR
jgi:hypothetical protein